MNAHKIPSIPSKAYYSPFSSELHPDVAKSLAAHLATPPARGYMAHVDDKSNPYAFDADLLLGPKDGFWAIRVANPENGEGWQKTAIPSSVPLGEILPEIQAANPGKTILPLVGTAAEASACTCANGRDRAPWWVGTYKGSHLPGCPALGGLRGLTDDEYKVMLTQCCSGAVTICEELDELCEEGCQV
jgi:hypothetical protein